MYVCLRLSMYTCVYMHVCVGISFNVAFISEISIMLQASSLFQALQYKLITTNQPFFGD